MQRACPRRAILVCGGRAGAGLPPHPAQRWERRHLVSPGSEAAQSPFRLQPPPGSRGGGEGLPSGEAALPDSLHPRRWGPAEAPQSAPSERAHSLGWSWGQNAAGVVLRPFSSAGGLPPALG